MRAAHSAELRLRSAQICPPCVKLRDVSCRENIMRAPGQMLHWHQENVLLWPLLPFLTFSWSYMKPLKGGEKYLNHPQKRLLHLDFKRTQMKPEIADTLICTGWLFIKIKMVISFRCSLWNRVDETDADIHSYYKSAEGLGSYKPLLKVMKQNELVLLPLEATVQPWWHLALLPLRETTHRFPWPDSHLSPLPRVEEKLSVQSGWQSCTSSWPHIHPVTSCYRFSSLRKTSLLQLFLPAPARRLLINSTSSSWKHLYSTVSLIHPNVLQILIQFPGNQQKRKGRCSTIHCGCDSRTWAQNWCATKLAQKQRVHY